MNFLANILVLALGLEARSATLKDKAETIGITKVSSFKFQVWRSGFRISSVAVSCFLLFASCAFAQQFSIGWAKITGGSSTSSGGAYSVSGSISPAVAGAVSGGNYTLGNSYWGIIAGVQSPGVQLAITAAGLLLNGNFELEVNGNLGQTYMLQASTNLTDWVTVLTFTCTNSPMVVADPDAGNHQRRFYRIAQ
jgi:hypothetical protein